MTERYTPQVGDTVTNGYDTVAVASVGNNLFIDAEGDHWWIHSGWSKVPDPPVYHELWINRYSWGVTYHRTREEADACAYVNRIDVVHQATDGTLTVYPTTGGNP